MVFQADDQRARAVKFRTLEGVDVFVCPFCGRRIAAENETCTFRHEEPACPQFFRALKARFPSFQVVEENERTMFVDTGPGKAS
jgi:hypothetical protein